MAELKVNKNGAFVISSKAHVRLALDTLDRIDEQIAMLTEPWQEERQMVKEALDKYVIDKFQPGDGYEDDDWLATKVVSTRRSWDVEKLTKLVPRGILKNLVKMTVDNGKVDEYVRSGKLDRDKIEPAYTETPNSPYVKITRRNNNTAKIEKEAAGLAARLT